VNSFAVDDSITDSNGFMYIFTGIFMYDCGRAGRLRTGRGVEVVVVVVLFLLLPQDKKNISAMPSPRARVIDVIQQISKFPR